MQTKLMALRSFNKFRMATQSWHLEKYIYISVKKHNGINAFELTPNVVQKLVVPTFQKEMNLQHIVRKFIFILYFII